MDKSDNKYEAGRFFLKDTVRLHVDFSQTEQQRGLAPPPLQLACPSTSLKIDLPDGCDLLRRCETRSLGEAIASRESVRKYDDSPLTMEELAMLLWATQGVRRVLSAECALRAVPSAGARHAFETYLAVNKVDSLAPGLYRYLPFGNQLALLYHDQNIAQRAAQACHQQGFVARAAIAFFWTAVPARMEWRYDIAAHTVIALDAGHVCQNLYLACEGIGAGTCAIAAYDQQQCDELLGVDGEDEFTIYIAAVGKKRRQD